jgi:glycosyltransferase involved in cell wall biosynthesis
VTGLSVIIPAYNEEQSIGQVVAALSEQLASTGWPFEIIVVDDGSSDRTAAQAEAAGGRLLRHAANRGYGAAIKTGIGRSHYDLICIIDADGTYPREVIPDLIEHMVATDSDMVVGARIGQNVAIPLLRRPAKWVIGRLAELASGQRIPDLNSGLRAFRRRTMMQFFGILPDGFSFTTTGTLAMLANGYSVSYMPINYHARVGRSKIRPLQDTLNFMTLVLRIALYFVPLRIFLPLSGLLLLLATGWAAFSKFVMGQLADVSALIIAMTAVQIAVVGLLAELINVRLPSRYRNRE